jgi:type IV secretory pathway VirB10-like protein
MFPHDDDLQPFGPLDEAHPAPEASAVEVHPAPLGTAPGPLLPHAPEAWNDADVHTPGDGLGTPEPPPADAPRAADVLDPEGDGRNEPVGIDRKFVLAGLLIAGTVLCLILVAFGGGGSTDPVAQAATPTPAPGAYIDEATAGYYDEAALDPAAPVDPAYDPYAAQAYGAGAYGGGSYGSGGASHGYATTQAYGPTETPRASGSRTTPGGAARTVDPARESYERAVASPLLVGSPQGPPASPTPQAPSAPADLGPEAAEELAFMREVAAMFPQGGTPPPAPPGHSGPGGTMALTSQPASISQAAGQGARAANGGREAEPAAVRRASGGLTLRAGSVIPAALVTGMNSDLPGPVVAQVTRNVYDSATQRDVLIPAGTRLVGEYDDQIAYGQNRALVAWTQMLFPDGTSVDLPGLPGADLAGQAGLSDRVDRHYGRVFGSALLLAAVGAGVEMAAPNDRRIGFDVSPQEVASRQIAIELSRVATETVRRDLRVEPTVRVSPGYRFYVLLAQDLPFAAPYRPRAAVGRFARPSGAGRPLPSTAARR